jgi:hypothetical protein
MKSSREWLSARKNAWKRRVERAVLPLMDSGVLFFAQGTGSAVHQGRQEGLHLMGGPLGMTGKRGHIDLIEAMGYLVVTLSFTPQPLDRG